MCSCWGAEPLSSNPTMEDGLQKNGGLCIYSHMLEFAASDDVIAFSHEVEVKGCDVDETSLWYGRQLGGKKMGFEERSPIMIAAMFGSVNVLKYIVGKGNIDVNRACGSDRATALHCAAAGGSSLSVEIVRILLDASADPLPDDANGKKPRDLIAPSLKYSRNSCRSLEILLKKTSSFDDIRVNQTQGRILDGETFKEGIQGNEKKEFPSDVLLPDINNGIYVSDEFRMYSFKVKPCSRAYSHDWTECPFVHPGENARRRDPRKYPYSCVPCPEFRKGTCRQGDACEYAHGVFECWLHPAQYRTRLCKDETNCTRKVCFFAHKSEELRPLYASTGSAIPSPRSLSPTSLSLSSSLLVPPISMPPISPSVSASPKNGTMWNKLNFTPPSLQLPSSRLQMASSVRDIENILGRKQLIDEFSASPSSPFYWNKEYGKIGEVKPDFDDVFGYADSPSFSQLQGHHLKSMNPSDLQSQGINPHLLRYLSNSPSFLDGMNSSFGLESPGPVGTGMMNSRSGALSKRSKSFVDRDVLARGSGIGGTPVTDLSGWCSPDGKPDWALKGEELNKLRKSATFAIRGRNTAIPGDLNLPASAVAEEPDISWVNSLVKDVSSDGDGLPSLDQQQYPWVEQMCIEQEQIFA